MSRKTDALWYLEGRREDLLLKMKGLRKGNGLEKDYYQYYDYAVCAIKLLTPLGESYVLGAVNPNGDCHREPILEQLFRKPEPDETFTKDVDA